MEYERRATSPKRVPERLRPYRRYFRSGYARLDHWGAWPFVLFVFESADAEETFVEVAGTLDHALVVSTHTDMLAEKGGLGESWRLPPRQPPGRRSLHDIGSALAPVQTSPSARPERFL